MRLLLNFICVLCVSFFLLVSGCREEAVQSCDIFVSPAGDDANTGSSAQPLKTLAAALEAAKSIQGATIRLAGGIYNPSEIIKLDESNSGSEGKPLVICAVEGQEVIFTRGEDIAADLFKKVENPEQLGRLHQTARGKVFVASLAGTGLEDYFTYRPDANRGQMYALVSWNGHLLNQAQWPNLGYDYISKTLEKGPTTRWLKSNEKPAAYSIDNPSGGRFTVRGDIDLAALKKEFDRTRDVSVYGYHSNDWFYQKENVGAVDPDNNAVQLLRYTRYGVGNKKLPLPRRVKFVNVLCQIDEPGEWYYDYNDKLFYIWPVQPISDDKPLRVVGGDMFIEARGVDYVTLLDITFENFGDSGVFFEGCSHILVGGCKFRSGLGLGLTVVDGMYNTITGCDFYGLDRAFLLLGEYPEDDFNYESPYKSDINIEYNKSTFSKNRRDLIPEHNVASNNHIYDCRRRGYGIAAVGGVGARMSNCLVNNVNGGIMYGHNDFVAEFNEFYDCGYEMGDWNVCYCGADLSLYNNMFRYNFAHHFMETPKGHPISAWRADDNASGLKTFGNIYYKTGRSGVQGGAPDGSIENTVSIGISKLWWTVQRPYHEIPKKQFLQEKYDKHMLTQKEIAEGTKSLFDKDNIIGRAELVFGKEGWKNNKRWIEHYPLLPKIFGNFFDPESNPWIQCYNVVRNNYSDVPSYKNFHIHGRNKLNSFEEQKDFLPDTMIFEEPKAFDPYKMFVDYDNMDLRMRDEFVPMDGFVKIPFEKIGLYLDEYRREMPNKQQYRNAVRQKYINTPSHGGRFDYDKVNERYSPPAYLILVK